VLGPVLPNSIECSPVRDVSAWMESCEVLRIHDGRFGDADTFKAPRRSYSSK
jgi:hypothetical protein